MICVTNAGTLTRGYPFTLSGEGYGKELYPLTGMGTGDDKLGGTGKGMGWLHPHPYPAGAIPSGMGYNGLERGIWIFLTSVESTKQPSSPIIRSA